MGYCELEPTQWHHSAQISSLNANFIGKRLVCTSFEFFVNDLLDNLGKASWFKYKILIVDKTYNVHVGDFEWTWQLLKLPIAAVFYASSLIRAR